MDDVFVLTETLPKVCSLRTSAAGTRNDLGDSFVSLHFPPGVSCFHAQILRGQHPRLREGKGKGGGGGDYNVFLASGYSACAWSRFLRVARLVGGGGGGGVPARP